MFRLRTHKRPPYLARNELSSLSSLDIWRVRCSWKGYWNPYWKLKPFSWLNTSNSSRLVRCRCGRGRCGLGGGRSGRGLHFYIHSNGCPVMPTRWQSVGTVSRPRGDAREVTVCGCCLVPTRWPTVRWQLVGPIQCTWCDFWHNYNYQMKFCCWFTCIF